MILDGSYGLLVDITLVLDTKSNEWAHERLTMVMVIGHLEESDVSWTRFHNSIMAIDLHLYKGPAPMPN